MSDTFLASRLFGEPSDFMPEWNSDAVYTPDWAAKDMVNFFKPEGKVLEPCKGGGVFLRYLPQALWCEIEENKDFYNWHEQVDWVISNPPYSQLRQWFRHSYTIAANIVYLVPVRSIFSGFGFVREIYQFGGIKHIRFYGTGNRLNFPMGNAVGAVHVQRDYDGDIGVSFASC